MNDIPGNFDGPTTWLIRQFQALGASAVAAAVGGFLMVMVTDALIVAPVRLANAGGWCGTPLVTAHAQADGWILLGFWLGAATPVFVRWGHRVVREGILTPAARGRATAPPLPATDAPGLDLRGAALSAANLAGADLSRADLAGASLREARAETPNARLWALSVLVWGLAVAAVSAFRSELAAATVAEWLASLPWVMLGGIPAVIFSASGGWMLRSLRRSAAPVLEDANLHGADLTAADLPWARLARADFQEAVLTKANLFGASLCGADLQGAHARKAKLWCARLDGSRLQGADLTEADLSYACLRDADLRGARLVRANLANADLRGADLRGADLRAQLSCALLKGARYDDTTRWPASFQPSRHGAVTAAEVVPAPLPQGRGDEPSPSLLPPARPGGQV